MFVGSCVTVGSGFGSNGAHLELLEHGGQTVACAFGRWVWPPARLPLFLLAGARPRSPAPSPAWLRRFTLPGQKIPKFSPDSPEKAFNPSRIESRASSTTQRLQGGVLNRPLGSDCFLARAPDLRGPRGCPPVAGKPRGHRQSTWFLHDGGHTRTMFSKVSIWLPLHSSTSLSPFRRRSFLPLAARVPVLLYWLAPHTAASHPTRVGPPPHRPPRVLGFAASLPCVPPSHSVRVALHPWVLPPSLQSISVSLSPSGGHDVAIPLDSVRDRPGSEETGVPSKKKRARGDQRARGLEGGEAEGSERHTSGEVKRSA